VSPFPFGREDYFYKKKINRDAIFTKKIDKNIIIKKSFLHHHLLQHVLVGSDDMLTAPHFSELATRASAASLLSQFTCTSCRAQR
jgi:hypothetical protein